MEFAKYVMLCDIRKRDYNYIDLNPQIKLLLFSSYPIKVKRVKEYICLFSDFQFPEKMEKIRKKKKQRNDQENHSVKKVCIKKYFI